MSLRTSRLGLLSNKLVGSSPESHPIAFDEYVTVLVEAVHQHLEVCRKDTEEAKGVDKRAHEQEVASRSLHQGVLESINARDFEELDLEAGSFQSGRDVLDGGGEDGTEQRLHLAQEFSVLLLFGVVLGQANPFKEADFSAGLEHAEHLLEERVKVSATDVAEGLDFVEAVEGLVLEVERAVEISNLELETILKTQVDRVLDSVGYLARFNVDTGNGGTAVASNVGSDTPPTASNVEHLHAGTELKVTHHFFFIKALVAHDAALVVHQRRDVHFLNLSHGTEVVEHHIVVLDLVGIFGRYCFLLEQGVGLEEGVDHILRHGIQGVEGADCCGHPLDVLTKRP